MRVLSAARSAPNTASTRDIALHGSHAARPSSSLGIEFWQTTGAEKRPSIAAPQLRRPGLREAETSVRRSQPRETKGVAAPTRAQPKSDAPRRLVMICVSFKPGATPRV